MSRSSTIEEIKDSNYKYSLDTARFKKIKEAFQVLSDPETRRQYDEYVEMVDFVLLKGQMLIESNELQQALQVLETIRKESKDAKALCIELKYCLVDHYRVLGLDHSATQRQIEQSFQEKAKTLDPDQLQAVNEAHQILSDEDSKRIYDGNLALFNYTPLVMVYFQQKNWNAVIHTASERLAINPDNADLLYYRGMAYVSIGQFDTAYEDYRRGSQTGDRKGDFETLKRFYSSKIRLTSL